VYARTVNDQILTFCVSGNLWNRSLVMMDIETESFWSHILGLGKRGPMEGAQLEIIPAELTTWGRWAETHPETSVLNLSRTHEDFTHDFYENPEDFVYGWRLGAKTYASTFGAMRQNPSQNLDLDGDVLLLAFDTEGDSPILYSRTLDGVTHTFELEGGSLRDAQTKSVWTLATGVCIDGQLKGASLEHVVGIVSFTKSWFDFHPDTELVQP